MSLPIPRILELDDAVKRIANAAKENKLVLFVGAGVSCTAGLPGWGKLLAPAVNALRASARESLVSIAEEYQDKHTRAELLKLIKQAIGKVASPSAVQGLLPQLKPMRVFTTNYDGLLQKVFDEKQWELVAAPGNASILEGNAKAIVHLHGHIEHLGEDGKELVITKSDYSKAYETKRAFFKRLESHWQDSLILFLGYGGADDDIVKHAESMASVYGEKLASRHIALDLSDSRENGIKTNWKPLRADLVLGRQLEGKGRSEKLEYFLQQCIKAIAPKAKSTSAGKSAAKAPSTSNSKGVSNGTVSVKQASLTEATTEGSPDTNPTQRAWLAAIAEMEKLPNPAQARDTLRKGLIAAAFLLPSDTARPLQDAITDAFTRLTPDTSVGVLAGCGMPSNYAKFFSSPKTTRGDPESAVREALLAMLIHACSLWAGMLLTSVQAGALVLPEQIDILAAVVASHAIHGHGVLHAHHDGKLVAENVVDARALEDVHALPPGAPDGAYTAILHEILALMRRTNWANDAAIQANPVKSLIATVARAHNARPVFIDLTNCLTQEQVVGVKQRFDLDVIRFADAGLPQSIDKDGWREFCAQVRAALGYYSRFKETA